MEEKIIIKSEKIKAKKLFLYALIIGVIAFIIVFVTVALPRINNRINHYSNIYNIHISRPSSYYYDEVKSYSSGFSYGLSRAMSFYFAPEYIGEMFLFETFWGQVIFSFVFPQVIVGIIYLWIKDYKITVTENRVFGKVAFGKVVDMPVDSIRSVKIGRPKRIIITTVSGKENYLFIKNSQEMLSKQKKLISKHSFFFIKNNEEIYEVLRRMVIEKQTNQTIATDEKTIVSSERYKVKKIFLYALGIGLVAFLLRYFVRIRILRVFSYYLLPDIGYYFLPDIIFTTPWGQFFYLIVKTQIIAAILYLWLKNYELKITEDRVVGKTAFGKFVDIPVDSINMISLGFLKSIKLKTFNGNKTFLLIKNRQEIYEKLKDLISERQSRQPQQVINQPANVPVYPNQPVNAPVYPGQAYGYDAPSGGFAVLGFFIPLVGFILYLVWKDTTPLRAKSAGKGALIGFITSVSLTVLTYVAYFIFLSTLF